MNENTLEYERLKPHANPRQLEVIDTIIANDGHVTNAAKALGYTDTSGLYKILRRVKKEAARVGDDKEILKKASPGFSIDRVSSFVDEDGAVKRQWVIANRDKADQFNSMMTAWEDFAKTIPKVTLTPTPTELISELLCDYTIGDNHTGLYTWAKEAGDNWDLVSSVDILKKAMNHLVDCAPSAKTAYILDVGDFFHADNQANETTHSGHKLDVDGRWAKVLYAGVGCICHMIDLALQKHEKVLYRSVIGNHNDHSAVMMNLAVKLRYTNEPRVEVLDSPAIHHYYQFGSNLLADTHGHTTKPDRLPLLMATDVPSMWAGTHNRVWRTGHVHHLSQKEFTGCSVITYRTLAPKDAWHAGQGYRSNREMRCTTYHKEKGTVGVNIVNPSMLGY